jgi:hypothetical protein
MNILSSKISISLAVAALTFCAWPLTSYQLDLGDGITVAAEKGAGGPGSAQGGPAEKGRAPGDRGGAGGRHVPSAAESDDGSDSDRPAWAGPEGDHDVNPHAQGGGKPDTAGTRQGDIYGDLWVIVRDENGVPILYVWEDGQPVQSPDGFPQPIAADGSLIPLDAEGKPIDESLVQEVDLGRLNIGRSPTKVSEKAYDAAIDTLNSATSISLDTAGRFVVTLSDGTVKTIDSPLENLALYVTLMDQGYLPGLTASDAVLGSLTFLKDSALTAADMKVATSLLAAAADKTGNLSVDQVAYLNNILKIAEMTSSDYVDYSSFDYSRSGTYSGTITYYVQKADGTVVQVTEPIIDAVFGGEDYTSSDGTAIADFAQAADDALQVIEFVHTQIHTE